MEKVKKRKYVSVARTPKSDQPHKSGLSEFAKFTVALKGHDLYLGNNKKIEKWQAFHSYDRNTKRILEGKSIVKAHLHRPELIEIN